MVESHRHNTPKKRHLAGQGPRQSLLRGVIVAVLAASLGQIAFAQDAEVETTDNLNQLRSEGFTINVEADPLDLIEKNQFDFIGLSPSLEKPIVDLPGQSVGSRLFNLDFADIACAQGDPRCLTQTERLDVRYNTSFAARIDKGLDIELSPRASVSFDDESSSALVGALVRIGDDLKDTSDFKNNTWYMFAGADAEAVTYSPNSMRRLTNGEFYLHDKIIVGDAQAGVGYRIGDADVSLGYFRREMTSFGREVDSGSTSFTEDAAALSFTWRR